MSTSGVVAALSPAEFVQRYGGIYEHSPWVAEAVLAGGLSAADDDPAALAGRMAAIVETSGKARQLELLRLHPELAGKLKIGEELTQSSKREQASAHLDQCTAEEYAEFQSLNTTYRERFGFPFIIAVAGLGRSDILAAFRRRTGHTHEIEFRAALDQVHKIARLRLAGIAQQRAAQA